MQQHNDKLAEWVTKHIVWLNTIFYVGAIILSSGIRCSLFSRRIFFHPVCDRALFWRVCHLSGGNLLNKTVLTMMLMRLSFLCYSSLCEAAIYLCPSVPILKAVSPKNESPISGCIIEHQATGEGCTAVCPLSMRTRKLSPCSKHQMIAKYMVVGILMIIYSQH